MLLKLLPIAYNTFVESIRQPIFFVLVMLAGVLQVMSTWSAAFSMGYSTSAEVHGDNKWLLDIGLASVFLFGMLLAAFSATAAVSREIENHTVLTVVSKPVARAALVLGKYVGVTGAILLALVIMLIALLLGLRHGVMSTAADELDGPVLVLGVGAVAIALVVGVVGNYLYGWHFCQTALLLMAPLLLIAYACVLGLGKEWKPQAITTDLKPQILTACAALTVAVLVLSAVATAVSTRLGQVMTIVVCAGVFVFGLLSNHFVGRRAFQNEAIGEVERAESPVVSQASFNTPGATCVVTLRQPPNAAVRPGMAFYYGPTPNGFPLISPAFTPFAGDVSRDDRLAAPATGPALVITGVQGRELTVRNVGAEAVRVPRPPAGGDYVFVHATRIGRLALAIWAVVPNMHHFWLVDPVTQNRPVPAGHLGLIGLYGLVQIGAWLALGVALFQKRDVG